MASPGARGTEDAVASIHPLAKSPPCYPGASQAVLAPVCSVALGAEINGMHG